MPARVNLVALLVLVPCLFSAVLAQSAGEALKFNVNRFVINGENPIGDKAYKVLQPYLGEQSGLDGLSAAADALELAIIDAGYSFHRVSLPPQSLTSGTVEFTIVRFAIGAINISGNEYFDRQNIEHSLPQLKVGETPNTKELSRSLKLANNHASKSMVLRFSEGGEGDTIDADITVKEQNPQIVFLTLDNTGSEETEEFRSTVGYQHGNLFNRDHAVTATLTFAPEDPDATTQYGVSYHIPLYAHGANLDFLLSDSEINTGEVASNIEITGRGSIFGFNYSRPLLSDTAFNHQWSAGIYAKSFENEQTTGGTPFSSDVLSLPLQLGYSFTSSMQSGALSGGLILASNIDAGSNNTDQDYALATNGRADSNSWSSIKYSLAFDRLFAQNWLFHIGLSGQDSGDNLIPGEQFGVGGSATLRGFEERSVTGDSGHQVSIEAWTPAYGGSRFLVFYDLASVDINSSTNVSSQSFDLSSAGIGWRFAWKQQLSVSLDYGIIIDGLGPNEGVNAGAPVADRINLDDDDRAHFNLVYRF